MQSIVPPYWSNYDSRDNNDIFDIYSIYILTTYKLKKVISKYNYFNRLIKFKSNKKINHFFVYKCRLYHIIKIKSQERNLVSKRLRRY